MKVFTPTASSQFIAGFTFWAVIWSLIIKIDKLAKLAKLDRWISSKKILDWINENKVLALLCSEFVNFCLHDPSTASGTTTLIGGTLFNSLMIFVFMPFRNLFGQRREVI